MALLRPFRGVRPPANLAPKIASPPYDVVNRDEAREYAEGNAHSFLHVSRPEIDLPAAIDEHAPEVYDLGAQNLKRFVEQRWLERDPVPHAYLYRQKMGSHVQTGVVAVASVDEYDRGLIKKHELTRPDKEDDRTQHLDALGGNDEPVFLTYRADSRVDDLVARAAAAEPEYDFVTEDRISHTFWVLDPSQSEQLVRAFAEVPYLYVADGHHRSAAASRVNGLRRSRGLKGSHDFFLAVIFPHNQMQILDYNRVVEDLAGKTPKQFLAEVEAKFSIEATTAKKPRSLHQFGMFLGNQWYQLTAKPGSFPQNPIGVLDVSILQDNLLNPVLGIKDPRKDPRVHFVGGIRGSSELERLVNSRDWAVAFSMFPTSLDQLFTIADAGEIMPPKSTWFEPKLRSGLVLHLYQ